MGKKSRRSRGGGGGGSGPSGTASHQAAAAAEPAPAAAAASSSANGGSKSIPPHSISLETNLGVPCWMLEELPTGQQTGWPDCNVCGKANSSKFCPKCVEWGLPLEVTCSRECFEQDYKNHVKRLHIPEGEWVAGKKIVRERAAQKGDPEASAMYERIFSTQEKMYPHPRDRNEARQRLAQTGREMADAAREWGY